MNLTPYTPKTESEFEANIAAYIVSKGVGLTNFKDGSRLKTLIEAVSLELSKISYEFMAGAEVVKRQSCYETFNFGLLTGNKASGYLRYEKSGHIVDVTIPIFTISLFGVSYKSTQIETLPVGETYILISIIAEESGTSYNIDANYIDTASGNGDFNVELDFDRVYNPNIITGGTDIESEEDRDLRFKEYISNLARSTVKGIESGLKQITGVIDSYVLENINPDTGVEETGWVLCYISDGTENVSQGLMDETYRVIQGVKGNTNYSGYKAGGVKVRVLNVEIQKIDITYSVEVLDETLLTDLQVATIIENKLVQIINSQRAGFDILIKTLEGHVIASHPHFYKFTITIPSSDVIVAPGMLPRVGILTCSSITRVPRS